jgi:hypothetical protein
MQNETTFQGFLQPIGHRGVATVDGDEDDLTEEEVVTTHTLQEYMHPDPEADRITG